MGLGGTWSDLVLPVHEDLGPNSFPLSTLGVIHAHRGACAGCAPAAQASARLFQQPEARAGLSLCPLARHQSPGGIQTVGTGLCSGLLCPSLLSPVLHTRVAHSDISSGLVGWGAEAFEASAG